LIDSLERRFISIFGFLYVSRGGNFPQHPFFFLIGKNVLRDLEREVPLVFWAF
jgi:hypothetical protein